MAKPLENWLRNTRNDKQSRTCGISIKNESFLVRISHYFEHYKDGLDARGEGQTLDEAAKDAILHFHQLLWKQIVRRSNDVRLNELKNEEHDMILKEMKDVQKKDFASLYYLKDEEYRDKIFKNNDILELQKDK